MTQCALWLHKTISIEKQAFKIIFLEHLNEKFKFYVVLTLECCILEKNLDLTCHFGTTSIIDDSVTLRCPKLFLKQ